jgi:hypothetical protein
MRSETLVALMREREQVARLAYLTDAEEMVSRGLALNEIIEWLFCSYALDRDCAVTHEMAQVFRVAYDDAVKWVRATLKVSV